MEQEDSECGIMMRKVVYMFFSLFAMVITGGCREMECVEEIDSSHARNSIYLNLSLFLNDGSSTVSRATDEGEIPGTSGENEIHSLYMYIFNSKSDNLVYLSNITNLKQSENEYSIKLDIDNIPEKVKIYLAANLTREQAESIQNTKSKYKTTATSYTRAINDFAPYEFMPQFGVTGISPRNIGIAMTGQAVSGETREFNIHEFTTPDKPLQLNVGLKRVVAKALLTVDAADNSLGKGLSPGSLKGVDYAVIASSNDYKGWVRISDIYYFPNGTNKSLYWFEQKDADVIMDPNQDLTDYITSTETDSEIALNTAKYQEDFVYYNQTEQYKLYYAYYQAIKFDSNKDNSNSYTDGMYFLENTFNIPESYKSQLDNYKLALPMVTSISIALRYTPKEIYVEKGLYGKLDEGTGMSASERNTWNDMKGSYTTDWKYFEDNSPSEQVKNIVFKNEAHAKFVLTMSLKLNKAYISSTDYANQVVEGTYSGTKFPDNTFFAFTPETGTDESFLYHYYTYGARQNIVNPIYYVPYVGGWAYYYTYLDGTDTNENPANLDGTDTNENRAKYSASQVTRNTYYILKLNKITRLGGSKTDPNNIQVNTTVVPWKKGGSLNVDLW